jgi:hypothetical protein
VGGGHLDDSGPIGGQGAGLVQGDAAHRAERLQRGPTLDQRTELASRADGGDHGDRHRDRQAHGEAATSTTRARSIHTAGSASRLPITAIRAAAIITGHQRFGDAVGQALGGALARLLGLHDLHDAGQRVVLRWW